jgi:phosphoserine phosphatase RsbU/P
LSSEDNRLGGRFLVVEDDAVTRQIMGAMLKRHGAASVELAESGAQALEIVQTFTPDLVLLDIVMEGMDGVELCAHLRKSGALPPTVPVIVTTGLNSGDARLRALRAGASGFLHKPVDEGRLLSVIRLHLEEKRLLKKADLADTARIRAFQEQSMPGDSDIRAIEQSHNVVIRRTFRPSAMLGGDVWALRPAMSGGLLAAVADFSGHGIGAAVNARRFGACLDAACAGEDDPARILAALNTLLHPMLPRGEYAACLIAHIDAGKKNIRWAGAGSVPGMLLWPGGWRELSGRGFLLGAYADADFPAMNAELPDDFTLLLHSDALTEPNAAGRKPFTTARLGRLGHFLAGLSPGAVHDGIVRALDLKKHMFDDDLTLLTIASEQLH